MAIPAVEQFSQQPGGGIVTAMRGQNALAQSYADAASKMAYATYLPAQLQAQVLSNPLLWATLQQNPALAQNMLRRFLDSVPQGNTGMVGNGLLTTLFNKITGKGATPTSANISSSEPSSPSTEVIPTSRSAQANSGYSYDNEGNNVRSTPQEAADIANNGNGASPSSTALVPSAQGMVPGVSGKMTAEYRTSPYPGGKTFTDENGNPISAPAGGAVDAAQQAIQGINNLKPLLQEISAGASKWLAPGQEGKMEAAEKINWLQKRAGTVFGALPKIMNKIGVTEKDLSDYAAWQADKQKAVETYMKARGWPITDQSVREITQIIEPRPGEGRNYADRITRELAQLEGTVAQNFKNTLSGGFPLTGNQAQSQSQGSAKTANSAPIMMKVYDSKHNLVAKGPLDKVNKFLADHKGYYARAYNE